MSTTGITWGSSGTAVANMPGSTAIADAVVAKVAGLAVRGVPGVHALAGGVTRTVGALRERAGQANHAQGISVEVGVTQVAVDVALTAEYPVFLQDLAGRVRAAVADAVRTIVEMEVAEINVTVIDVVVTADDHLPMGRSN